MGTGSGIRKQLENERGWGRRGSPEDGLNGLPAAWWADAPGYSVEGGALLYLALCKQLIYKIYLLKNIKLIFQKY